MKRRSEQRRDEGPRAWCLQDSVGCKLQRCKPAYAAFATFPCGLGERQLNAAPWRPPADQC